MKVIVLSAIVFLPTSFIFSQKIPQDFILDAAARKPVKSLYNKMSFLDSRTDSTDFGFVLTGATNRKTKVITTVPVSEQVSAVFKALTSGDSGNGESLFQLRRLQFSQVLETGHEKGYCAIRLCLYAKQNKSFVQLAFTDTLLEVKASEAREPLFTKAGEFMIDAMVSQLSNNDLQGRQYSFSNITAIDSVEKSDIPLYQPTSLHDGYYTSFSSFKQEIPDGSVSVTMKDDKVDVVKTTGRKGEMTKVLYPKDVYALVYNGYPFISTNYGFYPLQKMDDDFIFIGKASTQTSNSGFEAVNRLFFGITGALLEPTQVALYRIKIDHLTGQFIIIDEVRK